MNPFLKYIGVLVCLLFIGCKYPAEQESLLRSPEPEIISQAIELVSSDNVLGTIENGDFAHPHFSPDGRFLAYASVYEERGSESTDVRVFDLKTGASRVVLDKHTALKYATYAVFVTGLEWDSNDRLSVFMSDGDVDRSRVRIDVKNDTILDEGFLDTGANIPELPANLRRMRDKAVSLFPRIPKDVWDDAVREGVVSVEGRGMVIQKNYAGYDEDIWFIDVADGTMYHLLALGSEDNLALGGGVAVKDSVLFLVSHGESAILYEYRGGDVRGLEGIPKTDWRASFDLKYSSDDMVIFRIRAHHTYERGHNPLYLYNGKDLYRFTDVQELYDAAVDRTGSKIAFCLWKNGNRVLLIKKLKK